jgi:two-component sensor histidine kinase
MRGLNKYLISLTLAVSSLLNAQFNQEAFYKKFQNAPIKEKVKMVSEEPYENIKEIFPLLSDTLESIKKTIYNKTIHQEARLLFDKIDLNIEAYNKNYAKAIHILQKALNYHCSNIDDSLWCYINLKNNYIEIKDAVKAMEMNRFVEENYEKRKDKKISYGSQKSKLFYAIGLYKESIEQRKKEFLSAKPTPFGEVYLNNDLGHYFNLLKNSDSAEFYFLKAKAKLKNIPETPEHRKTIVFYNGLIDGNIASSKFNSKKYQEAIPLLFNDIKASIECNEYGSAYNSYMLLTQTYLKLNNPTAAKIYLDTIINFHKRAPHLYKSVKTDLILANYYALVKDYKLSASYYAKFIQVNDSINNLEKERQIINQGVAYNVQNKELELEQKNKVLAATKLEDSKQKTFRAYLLAGILMLLAVVVFLVLNNQYAKKREQELSEVNKQIYSQNLIIEQSLKEKELLIKEIHHRVKNNLQIITSMLSLQIGKTTNKESSTILNEAKQRIASIALTHQMLYQKGNLSSVLLEDFLSKLIYQIESTLPENNITLNIQLNSSETKVNIDTAIPLGLIVNEILTNCFKHAFPENAGGIISIISSVENQSLTLKISDDGVGFDVSKAQQPAKSLGLELIEILAEQLNCKMDVINNNGTTYVLKLNLS